MNLWGPTTHPPIYGLVSFAMTPPDQKESYFLPGFYLNAFKITNNISWDIKFKDSVVSVSDHRCDVIGVKADKSGAQRIRVRSLQTVFSSFFSRIWLLRWEGYMKKSAKIWTFNLDQNFGTDAGELFCKCFLITPTHPFYPMNFTPLTPLFFNFSNFVTIYDDTHPIFCTLPYVKSWF